MNVELIEFTNGLDMSIRKKKKELHLFSRFWLEDWNALKIKKTTGRSGPGCNILKMPLGKLGRDVK